jgi:hypothetical protein
LSGVFWGLLFGRFGLFGRHCGGRIEFEVGGERQLTFFEVEGPYNGLCTTGLGEC